MKISSLFALGLLSFFFSVSSELFAFELSSELALSNIQVKGTHNSYHQQSLIAVHASHKYTHLPLRQQLEERGIRAFELDVHQSVFGGDLAVYHIGVVDGKSSCAKFKTCLSEMRDWSNDNPGHGPIFVWIEIKDATGGPKFANFDQVDEEIREILSDRLITPDRVTGNYSSLQDAVANEGWPKLSEAKGKFVFFLDHDERTETVYLRDKSLAGRVMFPRANEETLNEPWAVVAKTGPGDFHARAMAKNFLLSDNICSPEDKPETCFVELQNAIRAGTHLLMDDFEGGAPAQSHGDYFLQFERGWDVQCNPAKVTDFCEEEALSWY